MVSFQQGDQRESEGQDDLDLVPKPILNKGTLELDDSLLREVKELQKQLENEELEYDDGEGLKKTIGNQPVKNSLVFL